MGELSFCCIDVVSFPHFYENTMKNVYTLEPIFFGCSGEMSEIYFSIACYWAVETAVAYLHPISRFFFLLQKGIESERAESYTNNESSEGVYDLYHIYSNYKILW